MADWHWELFQDDLLEGLPEVARAETDRLANEIAVRESMVFLEGAACTGPGPGVRTESLGPTGRTASARSVRPSPYGDSCRLGLGG
ncbi:hypothetical protein [Streptomyces geranii]|uniref:hypothetical protein n=1 Tax=Streptomyces geranii TaxID=2058923 RepID=UPI00130096C8|nr:hypothetical protein [Streptomyces geranii]